VQKQTCHMFTDLTFIFSPKNQSSSQRDIFIDAHLFYFKEIFKKFDGLWSGSLKIKLNYEVIFDAVVIWLVKADI
jgi:hypothetical protein